MAYYHRCKQCGCTMDTMEGIKYPGKGLVCEECAEKLDLEAEYRKKLCLTKNQTTELGEGLLASLS